MGKEKGIERRRRSTQAPSCLSADSTAPVREFGRSYWHRCNYSGPMHVSRLSFAVTIPHTKGIRQRYIPQGSIRESARLSANDFTGTGSGIDKIMKARHMCGFLHLQPGSLLGWIS
jgi:hypothetical protein